MEPRTQSDSSLHIPTQEPWAQQDPSCKLSLRLPPCKAAAYLPSQSRQRGSSSQFLGAWAESSLQDSPGPLAVKTGT